MPVVRIEHFDPKFMDYIPDFFCPARFQDGNVVSQHSSDSVFTRHSLAAMKKYGQSLTFKLVRQPDRYNFCPAWIKCKHGYHNCWSALFFCFQNCFKVVPFIELLYVVSNNRLEKPQVVISALF